MPWGVGKRGTCPASKPWAVYRKPAGGQPEKVVGCHPTEEHARAHQRALYAQEPGASSAMPGKEPLVGCEWFSAPIAQKAVTDTGHGEISGYASIYGNVDLQDDVMEPGAANKTVADWQRSKSKVPLLDWHGDSLSRLIGSVNELKTAGLGLWFKAGFSNTPEAQRARQLAQEGHLSGVSIGYLPLRQSFKDAGDRMIRHLHEIKLLEVSLTPVPANPLAQVAAVKAADQGNITTPDAADLNAAARRYCVSRGWSMPDGSYPIRPANMHGGTDLSKAVQAVGRGGSSHDAIRRHIIARARAIGMSDQIPDNWSSSGTASLDFERFAESMRSALDIGFEPARKAAIDLLAASYHPDEDAAGTGDGQPTAGAAAPDGGTAERVISDEASAEYALSFITPTGPRDGAPGGEPPQALAGPLAQLEIGRAAEDMDRLEAELREGRR